MVEVRMVLELKLSPIIQPKSLPLITRLPFPYCLGIGVVGVDKDVRVDVQVATSASWSLSTWVAEIGRGVEVERLEVGDPFVNH